MREREFDTALGLLGLIAQLSALILIGFGAGSLLARCF